MISFLMHQFKNGCKFFPSEKHGCNRNTLTCLLSYRGRIKINWMTWKVYYVSYLHYISTLLYLDLNIWSTFARTNETRFYWHFSNNIFFSRDTNESFVNRRTNVCSLLFNCSNKRKQLFLWERNNFFNS